MIPNLNNSGSLDGGDTSSGLSNYSGGLTVGDMYVNSKKIHLFSGCLPQLPVSWVLCF